MDLKKSATEEKICPAGMLDYQQIADRIGIPRGSLSRRLSTYNRRVPFEERIIPDWIDDQGHYRKHYFGKDSIERIEAIAKPRGQRGRPKKTREEKAA